MIKRVDKRKQMSSASGEPKPKTPAGENDEIKFQHTPTYKNARLTCK